MSRTVNISLYLILRSDLLTADLKGSRGKWLSFNADASQPMSITRRPRRTNHSNEEFEKHVTAVLEAQDRMLERLEQKLEKPVMNGGFEDLISKVEKIESVSEQLREAQTASKEKIEQIHEAVWDPDTGLYHKVKENTRWIATTGRVFKWLGGLLVAGVLTGVGKLLYTFLSGHIHFTP